jgi:hypothetical protein
MNSRTPAGVILDNDALTQYVSSVHGLYSKLATISAHQQEVALNLGRAATALRSLASSGARNKLNDCQS